MDLSGIVFLTDTPIVVKDVSIFSVMENLRVRNIPLMIIMYYKYRLLHVKSLI